MSDRLPPIPAVDAKPRPADLPTADSPSTAALSPRTPQMNRPATVYLIGAGPGDPSLLTLRGAERMSRCDVVLYDGLCNPELLRHAPQAESICVGKHGQSRIWRQDEIIAEMLSHARAGRSVARLKGGDPAVFARTAEEVDALCEAQIPFEIVPGITAALAAGSYAGIPITHRGLASAVALVTGHEEPGKSESALDWQALAAFPGTLVIYMGVTTAESWTRALIDAGKPPETPAALVRRCSYDDQQTIHCRLDEVAQRLTPASEFRPPVIVILGKVTELASKMNWMQQRPLSGQQILVTRPADQADALAGPLHELGATVLFQPAIEIGPPDSFADVDRVITSIADYQLIVFCSRNGVRYFLDRLLATDRDLRLLAGREIAVVGKQTAAALRAYHLHADIIPTGYSAAALADELTQTPTRTWAGKRCLVVRASRGKDVLADRLTAAGATVRQVVAYAHRDVQHPDPHLQQWMREGKIDWVTVTSSATAENLWRLFGDALRHCKLASLSPITTASLADFGLTVSAEADPYTMDALVHAILQTSTSTSTSSQNK